MFIFIQKETPRCPNCSKVEHKVEHCASCGYKYPEPKTNKPGALFGLFILVGAVLGSLFLTKYIAAYDPNIFDYFIGALLGSVAMFIVLSVLAGIVWVFVNLFSSDN